VSTGTIKARLLGPLLIPALPVLITVGLVLVMAIVGAVVVLQPSTRGFDPSARALSEIPPRYLRLYLDAGERYAIDPWVLAGIGSVESQHGKSNAPGVHAGVNAFGCCAGPMQFSIVGIPSTWDTFGVDGDNDGRTSVYDPADAIPAAARYLRASGAPGDYRAALFAYNHAQWYVDQVLAKANEYRGLARGRELEPPRVSDARLGEVLHNPRITLSPIQRSDLRSGLIDRRVITTMAIIARRHSIVITALRSDHSRTTVDGAVSNHAEGRAMDIGEVDGEVCRGIRTGACAELVRALARIEGPLRSTELIYCWDPDGPGDPRGFARSDHCDHMHVGWDA
jgi:hypothetical protein